MAGLCLLLLLAGCASNPPVTVPETYTTAEAVDFSGAWEIDYARSDDVNRELKSLMLSLSRGAGASAGRDPSYRQAPVNRSAASVNITVALAQLADEITRPQVLKIEQSEYDIEIDRGDEAFSLNCVLFDDRPEYEEGPLATELCGWNEDRLVFRTTLPDGLNVIHRLTLAPDGDQLHIATTLSAPGTAVPFTLSRFYNRFEPRPDRYQCEETLTRGRVCGYVDN
jgi:hypothetical protein